METRQGKEIEGKCCQWIPKAIRYQKLQDRLE